MIFICLMDIETGLLGFTEFLAYRSARINLKIDFFRFLFSYPSFSDYLDQSVEFYDIFNDFICFMDIETGLLGFYLVFFWNPNIVRLFSSAKSISKSVKTAMLPSFTEFFCSQFSAERDFLFF